VITSGVHMLTDLVCCGWHFRTAAYDTSLGSCLEALYATSHYGTIECTAQLLFNVLPQTVKQSPSLELKVHTQFLPLQLISFL
jgi:hypothetical protein